MNTVDLVAKLEASRIKAVLFDKDGTLVDSLGPWAQAERDIFYEIAERRFGAGSDEAQALARAFLDAVEIRERADGSVWFEKGAFFSHVPISSFHERLLETLARFSGQETSLAAFKRELSAALLTRYPAGGPAVAPMPGAAELLAALAARGYPLGIATNDDETGTRNQLEELGFLSYFRFVSCADTARHRKPHPHVVESFAQEADCAPREVAMVGDSEVDRELGAHAGLFLHADEVFPLS